jgi:hypothetical protein
LKDLMGLEKSGETELFGFEVGWIGAGERDPGDFELSLGELGSRWFDLREVEDNIEPAGAKFGKGPRFVSRSRPAGEKLGNEPKDIFHISRVNLNTRFQGAGGRQTAVTSAELALRFQARGGRLAEIFLLEFLEDGFVLIEGEELGVARPADDGLE